MSEKENKKSQNLDVVSNSSHEERVDASERRRLPRLHLTQEQFRLKQNGKVFAVENLSPGGMALGVIDRHDLVLFQVGAPIEGTLRLRDQKYELKARVKHLRGDHIGCEFETLSSSVEAALGAFLDPKVLGKELRPMPLGIDGALWYHGPSGTDLFFWGGADGSYRRFVVFIFGCFVEWDLDEGVRTGISTESREAVEHAGVLDYETFLLNPDDQADTQKITLAQDLLSVSPLPEELKRFCVEQVRGL